MYRDIRLIRITVIIKCRIESTLLRRVIAQFFNKNILFHFQNQNKICTLLKSSHLIRNQKVDLLFPPGYPFLNYKYRFTPSSESGCYFLHKIYFLALVNYFIWCKVNTIKIGALINEKHSKVHCVTIKFKRNLNILWLKL